MRSRLSVSFVISHVNQRNTLLASCFLGPGIVAMELVLSLLVVTWYMYMM